MDKNKSPTLEALSQLAYADQLRIWGGMAIVASSDFLPTPLDSEIDKNTIMLGGLVVAATGAYNLLQLRRESLDNN